MDHLAVLEREAAAVAAAARQGLEPDVPSCPGWSVGHLVAHLGVTHRWAAETVRTLSPDWIRGATNRWGREPSEPGLVEWFEAGVDELVAAIRAADPSAPVFTFGPPPTVAFWPRRQAMETLVHRWDVESAFGTPAPLDPDTAADAVDEHLRVFVPFRKQGGGRGETFHLHRTDGPGEWLVRFDGDDVTVSAEHAKGDLALRGSAEDLLLFLWGRVGVERLEVFGDPALVDRWFDLVGRA